MCVGRLLVVALKVQYASQELDRTKCHPNMPKGTSVYLFHPGNSQRWGEKPATDSESYKQSLFKCTHGVALAGAHEKVTEVV